MAKKIGNEKQTNNQDIVPLLNNLNRIEKPNCKLCQSELRDKAEEIYDSQPRKNYTLIQKKLKDEDNFDISAVSVRNHLLYHYKVVEDNKNLRDYAEDIQRWVGIQGNKVSSLKSRIALLEREMFTIGQVSEDLDIVERRKSAEVIKKLADTILIYENKLKEFKDEEKPINMIFNQLNLIVSDEMQHIESIKTKKVLSTVLERLRTSIGEIEVED